VIALCAILAVGAAEPGLSLLRAGKNEQAAASLSAALQKEPRNASIANDLGFA
jgi:Flp pilus assembly protein TadD